MRVIELRNYLLKTGATSDFIRYFETHFLFAQREEGMHVLGQFEVVDAPDRFVWIRGFEDMATRARGLAGFYGGAFWEAHRDEANEMMLEHHDVHLLRPLGSGTSCRSSWSGAPPDLTRGLALEDRASEPPGALPQHTGLIIAELYRAHAGEHDRLIDHFEEETRPALIERGHQILGHFVAELAPNDYPRLPVIQDPTVLVTLSAYRDREQHAAMRAHDRRQAIAALVAKDVETLCLRPTAKSLIRYREGG